MLKSGRIMMKLASLVSSSKEGPENETLSGGIGRERRLFFTFPRGVPNYAFYSVARPTGHRT